MIKKLLPLGCLLLGACSSVSVVEEREDAALAPKSAPSGLFVCLFDVPSGTIFDVAAPRGEDDPRISVSRTIAEGVLSRGSRWVAPSEIIPNAEKAPGKGLLVDGKVLVARQGSRALRIGVGFGAGRTRLETTVRVFNLEASGKRPWLTFKTTGGSNMEPGLIAGLFVPSPATIPLVAGIAGGAVSGVTKSHKGVTQDAKRTGRAVVAAIHDRLAARQLLPRKAWPKRIGSVGTPVGQLNVPSLDQ